MIFDKSRFDTVDLIPAVRIPARLVRKLLQHDLSDSFLYSRAGVKTVHAASENSKEYRVVLLRDKLPSDLVEEFQAVETDFELKLGYESLSTEEALRRLLPDCGDPPSSFETIGHIAHMNLRDEFLPHKALIGQVILDKNPHIETVITKIGSLSNEFRTFEKEIIASREGNHSLVASVSENKMRLTVDYDNCYWNSRLSFERARLLKSFTSTDPSKSRLIDMCCGVGALACFAAREGLEVFANDLNASAVFCARENASKNKVDLESFNMDGRDFVRDLVKTGKLKEPKFNHVMINLPEIGLGFLDVFRGLFNSETDLGGNIFQVYCHCFSREDPPEDARFRALSALGLSQESNLEISLVHVRDVSPNKVMYSVELRVPEEVLVVERMSGSKKVRLD